MKYFFVILAFFSHLVAARADFIIRQKVDGTPQSGILTLKIKGNKTRLDMSSESLGAVSLIQDVVTCDTIMMIHEKKTARKETGEQYRQRLEQLNPGGTNAAIPGVVDTGRTEKVGDYTAEIYTWTNTRDMSGTLWLARNYPNAEHIKKELARLNQSPVRQFTRGTTPDTSRLPGVVVKSTVKSPTADITTTLPFPITL